MAARRLAGYRRIVRLYVWRRSEIGGGVRPRRSTGPRLLDRYPFCRCGCAACRKVNTMQVCRLAPVFCLALLLGCDVKNVESPVSPSTSVSPNAGVIITAPRIVQPASGSRLTRDAHPLTLTIENASTSGGRLLSYSYEGSADPTFAEQVFKQDGVAPGGNGRTSVDVPGPLPS